MKKTIFIEQLTKLGLDAGVRKDIHPDGTQRWEAMFDLEANISVVYFVENENVKHFRINIETDIMDTDNVKMISFRKLNNIYNKLTEVFLK